MKKRVLIVYGSYGAGHFSAARSIKEYIDSNYVGIETKLVDCIEYVNKFFNKISIKTYDKLTRRMPIIWKGVYYGSETWGIQKVTSNTNKIFSLKLYKLLKNFNPDLIISTHFFSSEMCAMLKKKKKLNFSLATIMTDYAPHKQWISHHELIDYFFVAHNGMKKYLEDNKIDSSKIHVTGIPLSQKFLLNYDKEKILKEFGLEENKLTVLFFASGSSHIARGMAKSIFQSFVNSFPNLQILTITGKSPELKNNFEKIVKENNCEKSIKVIPFTNKVPELMYVSDVVITKPGGLTTTESLASGLPMIIIDPIPGQEEENAEFLEENGVAIWIRKHDNVDEVLNKIFSNPELLKDMKIKAKFLAKRNSTKDICEVVLRDD